MDEKKITDFNLIAFNIDIAVVIYTYNRTEKVHKKLYIMMRKYLFNYITSLCLTIVQ